MITIRRSGERGHANHGWLDTRHTFSFANYYDPDHMGFRTLRVINEDHVQGGNGFAAHPHRDMEIVTYVLDGALEHEDDTGHRGVIGPGTVQRMSAGSGIVHSEKNASSTAPVHLLQIWILPESEGIKPDYEERTFTEEALRGTLTPIVSRDGANGALRIHQDAVIHAGRLDAGDSVEHPLAPGRHGWVQVARGEVTLNGEALRQGDGAAASDEEALRIDAVSDSEVLVFDLA